MIDFKNILVNVDGQAPVQRALAQAVELCRASGAVLKIVDVVPDFSWPVRLVTGGYERVIEKVSHAKSERLKALVDETSQQGIQVSTKLLAAPSSANIIREVLRDGHDLVIREAKGRGSRRSGFFGTTSRRLLRKCPCPVLVLKEGQVPSCRRVAAAVSAIPEDQVHGQLNHRILEMARGFCPPETCHLDVVCAWSVYGESILREHMREEEFDELRKKTEAEAGRRLAELVSGFGMVAADENVHACHGDAGIEIPRFAEERQVDLLVMGTVGRSGMAGFLIGNTAEQILDRVQCSVLAVKPAGFVSPIRIDG